MKQSEKLVNNTIHNGIGYIWGLGISLLLTPYIFYKIGEEQFGIIVISEVIINYSSLLDLSGIGGAFVIYIAEYKAKKDYETINQIINLGVTYYLSFWIVICLAMVLYKRWILGIFNISPALYNEASFALTGIVIAALITGGLSVFRSVLLGAQRMDITNKISIGVSIVRAIGTAAFLSLGYGLKGLVVNSVLIAVLNMAAHTVYAYKILPIRFNPFNFSKTIFNRCIKYGFNIQIARFSELINSQVDKILLGHFFNISFVSFYELGYKIANTANSFCIQFLPVIVPASSELHALNDKERLNKLYYKGTKYISLAAFPIAFFLLYNADIILNFWMGKSGFYNSAATVRILIIGYLFTLIVSAGRLIARGIEIPQYEMRSSILILILNLTLSVTLIIKIGFVGTLIGSSVAAAVGSIYFIIVFHRHIKEPLKNVVINIYAPLFTVCIISGISFFVVAKVLSMINFQAISRGGYLLILMINGIVFMCVYIGLLVKTNYLDTSDKELFGKMSQSVKSLILRHS